MTQQYLAGLAAFIALIFAIAALSACASTEQSAPTHAEIEPPVASEFHDAAIGADALRSRL